MSKQEALRMTSAKRTYALQLLGEKRATARRLLAHNSMSPAEVCRLTEDLYKEFENRGWLSPKPKG